MPFPTDVSSLRSFLGLVIHYDSFLSSLHQIKSQLNKLLAKHTKWSCQQAFDKIKPVLNSDELLTHLDQTQNKT